MVLQVMSPTRSSPTMPPDTSLVSSSTLSSNSSFDDDDDDNVDQSKSDAEKLTRRLMNPVDDDDNDNEALNKNKNFLKKKNRILCRLKPHLESEGVVEDLSMLRSPTQFDDGRQSPLIRYHRKDVNLSKSSAMRVGQAYRRLASLHPLKTRQRQALNSTNNNRNASSRNDMVLYDDDDDATKTTTTITASSTMSFSPNPSPTLSECSPPELTKTPTTSSSSSPASSSSSIPSPSSSPDATEMVEASLDKSTPTAPNLDSSKCGNNRRRQSSAKSPTPNHSQKQSKKERQSKEEKQKKYQKEKEKKEKEEKENKRRLEEEDRATPLSYASSTSRNASAPRSHSRSGSVPRNLASDSVHSHGCGRSRRQQQDECASRSRSRIRHGRKSPSIPTSESAPPKRSILKADPVSASSKGDHQSKRKSRSRKATVSFDRIEIRRHPIILGDHPDCSRGPPVTMDWNCQSRRVFTVDAYEERYPSMERPRMSALQLDPQYRRRLIMQQSRRSRSDTPNIITIGGSGGDIENQDPSDRSNEDDDLVAAPQDDDDNNILLDDALPPPTEEDIQAQIMECREIQRQRLATVLWMPYYRFQETTDDFIVGITNPKSKAVPPSSLDDSDVSTKKQRFPNHIGFLLAGAGGNGGGACSFLNCGAMANGSSACGSGLMGDDELDDELEWKYRCSSRRRRRNRRSKKGVYDMEVNDEDNGEPQEDFLEFEEDEEDEDDEEDDGVLEKRRRPASSLVSSSKE